MSSVQLRVPLGLGHRLREIVYAAARHEPVAFCLVSHVEIDRTTVLFVRHVIPLNEADYVTGTGHGAAWRGSAMRPMIDLAMRERLGRVGESPETTSKRSFFHRGVREVFLAMGGGEVTSIGQLPSGAQVLSRAVFDPNKGMAIVEQDRAVTGTDRDELGLPGTGTRVRVPVRRFASKKPKLFEFGAIESPSAPKIICGTRIDVNPSEVVFHGVSGMPTFRLASSAEAISVPPPPIE